MYVEAFSTITDDMPLALVLLVSSIVLIGHRIRAHGVALRDTCWTLANSPMTYCVIGTAASAAVMLSSGWLTNRYVADMYPCVALLIPLMARFLARPVLALGRTGSVTVIGLVGLIVIWSLAYDLGAEYQTWWHAVI